MNHVWVHCIFPQLSPIDLARLSQCSKHLQTLLSKNELLTEWKNKLSLTKISKQTVYDAGYSGYCDLIRLLSAKHFRSLKKLSPKV